MEIKKRSFRVPDYDITYDKKIIINKLSQGRYFNDYDNITDYAILNGAKTSINAKGQRFGSYWLANVKDVYEGPMDMIAYGPDYTLQRTSTYGAEADVKNIGIRPVIKYSEIKDDSKIIETFVYPKVYLDDIYHVIEYGEYPQTIADNNTQSMLEKLLNNKLLNKTGRSFSHDIGNPTSGLFCVENDEYEYDGNRYVRVGNLNSEGTLSNGQKANKSFYWVKVEPIKWIVDVTEDTVWADKILIGGVAYNNRITACYENTYISLFMKHYFTREIAPKALIDINSNSQEKQNNEPNYPGVHKVKVKRRK